jgi:O-antigen/teichoic acid export membrane protein
MTETPAPPTSGSVLVRNAILSLVSQGAPLLVAVFSVPLLIRVLGTDRFGVLTLAWMVIGYFNLFDMGLSLALTKSVAEKLGNKQDQDLSALVWTALLFMLSLGLVGTVVVSLFAPWLVHEALKIPETLQPETLNSFYLLAGSLPIVINTAGLRGLLEARQRFALSSAVRLPMGMFTFLGPVMVLPFSHNLFWVVAMLVGGRIAAWGAYWLLCLHAMPELRHGIHFQRSMLRPLLRFGGWVTVSNIVGPLMVYLDRFLIASLVSIAAVAYYATPYEMITKLLLIPGALMATLFPAVASSFVVDRGHTQMLLGRGLKFLFLMLFPVTLVIVTLAEEGLNLWLGPDFAKHSTVVLQWLAIGVFINSLAQVPFFFIQGIGRPDLSAKFHLLELPVYLIALWWLIATHGLIGAAIAWVGRAFLDAVLLFGLTHRLFFRNGARISRLAASLGMAILTLALAMVPMGALMKGVFLSATSLIFATCGWALILAPDERTFLRHPSKLVGMVR